MQSGTRMGRGAFGAIAGLAALVGVACSQSEQGGQAPATGDATPPAAATTPPAASSSSPSAAPAAPSDAKPAAAGDAAKGKQIYAINCTACHNADPAKDGALGPAIAGSSLELVTARVLHGNYPPGYTPKRPTQQMVALPHLASVVPDLTAYLQSVK